jgi:hypothetical protein
MRGSAVREPARTERRSSAESKRSAPGASVRRAQAVPTVGNQGIRRLIQGQVGAAGPAIEFEREAELAAERIASTATAPRSCACGRPIENGGLCADCAGKQQRLASPCGPLALPGLPMSVERALRTHGRTLDTGSRGLLEPEVGADLGDVRVHTGSEAAAAAAAVRARAFTAGRHVVFGAGEYAPATAAGQKLLAHEMTHVVQQEHGPPVIQRAPDGQPPPAPAEVGPCEVDVPSLTNEQLIRQAQRAEAFLKSHEKGDDYYDYANLMRRVVDERQKRAREGHVWLVADPPAIPTALFELQPGEGLQVLIVPISVADELGKPGAKAATSVLTQDQLNRFLEKQSIPTVDAASYFASQDPQHLEPLRFLLPMPQAPPRIIDFTSADPFGLGLGAGASGAFPPGTFPSPFWQAPVYSTTGVVGGGLYQSPFDLASRPNVVDPVLSPNVNVTRPRSVSGARVEWRGDLPEIAAGWGTTTNMITYQDLNKIRPNFEVFDWRQRFTGDLVSVTHTLPQSGSWTPGSTGAPSNPMATPDFSGYHTKFLRAIGSEQAAKYNVAIGRLNQQFNTSLTPVDVAGKAYLAVNSDHVEAFRNDLEAEIRRSPGDYANLVDSYLREVNVTIEQPGRPTVTIASWNDLVAQHANGNVTNADRATLIDAVAREARSHVISSGMSTVQLARMENFRLANQGLSAQEFSARFPPEYLEAVRLGGAAPAIYESGVRGARTSAAIAGGIDVGRMIWNRDVSPQALTHLGIDVTTGYGGGFVGSTIESSVNIGTAEMFSQSTGALASAGRLGGRVFGGGLGGGVAAPLITMAAMGLDPYHKYTGIDYAAKGGRALVSGTAAGAGGALASAGVGALAGSEVPVLGTALGFLVGLLVYEITDDAIGDDVERQIRLDLGEGGCVKRSSTTTTWENMDWPAERGCFAAETLIRLPDGRERPIALLEPGDQVIGYDDAAGEFRTVSVVGNTMHLGRTCFDLSLNGSRRVRVTPAHPIRSESMWIAAGGLEEGSAVTCLDEDGAVGQTEVLSVVAEEESTTVFELSVDGCHTYFAGGILAHNKNI